MAKERPFNVKRLTVDTFVVQRWDIALWPIIYIKRRSFIIGQGFLVIDI
jgi:hypothetical protein